MIIENKLPPQNLLFEEQVIGALMIDSKSLVTVLPVLKPGVFFKEHHYIICEAILALVNENIPVDVLTVLEKVEKMGKIEVIGGYHVISDLANKAVAAHNAETHYRFLMELFFRREIMSMSYLAIEKSVDMTEDIFNVYDWINSKLDEIEIHISAGSFLDVRKTHEEAMSIINTQEEVKRFYPIGDPGIDDIIMTSPGNLVNISGKSGAGKTSFATYWARQLLQKYKNNVAFCWYTMEDEAVKILMSMISPAVKLTHSQMHEKNYKLSDAEKKAIQQASESYTHYDIEFFQKPAFISQIRAHFERFCALRPKKFNVLIIDNIMLLKDNHVYRFKSRGVEVDDHIATQIQSLFTNTKNNYDVNVWYLHHLTKEQLSKSNFSEGYRPREDNIKGSTRLRDIATQGLLIHRPAEFKDVVQGYKDTPYYEAIQNLIVCETFKNRNGNVGFFRYFAHLGYKIFYPFSN